MPEKVNEKGKRIEEKIRKKLTPYEWRKLKERIRLKSKLSEFQREFRTQLATFITGAFAFVAALLWRDAIKNFLDVYQTQLEVLLPFKQLWIVDFVMAFAVSIVAIIAIMIISKSLKVK